MATKREERAQPVRMVYFLDDLQTVLGLGRTSLYARIADGRLLDPIDDGGGLGPARKRWSVDDVHAWIAAGMPPAVAWRREKVRRRKRGA